MVKIRCPYCGHIEDDAGLIRKIDAQERLMNAMEVDDVLMPIYMYE